MTHTSNKVQVGIILPAGLKREVIAYCQAHDITPARYIEALVQQFEDGKRAAACHFSEVGESDAKLIVSLDAGVVDATGGFADFLAGNNRRYRGASFLADLIVAAHAKTLADINADRGRIPTDFNPTKEALTALEWPEGTSKVVAPEPPMGEDILWKPRRGRPRTDGTVFKLPAFPIESWQLGITPDDAAKIIHNHITNSPRLNYLQEKPAWMKLATHNLVGVKLVIKSSTEKRRVYRFGQLCDSNKQPWTWAQILNEAMAAEAKERRPPLPASE